MKIPRDVSGEKPVKALGKIGYQTTRQTGSHIRLTVSQKGEHHVTISNHNPLRIGTLAAILDDVSRHFEISREELLRKIDL